MFRSIFAGCGVLALSAVLNAGDVTGGDEVQPSLQSASAAMQRGEFQKAVQIVNRELANDPSNFDAIFMRATALDRLRDYPAAIADYSRLIEVDSNRALSRDVRADDRRGDAYLKNGQPKRAVADFDAFLKREPEFEPHHWRRGIAHYHAGAFEDGVAQFESHKKVNGDDVENSAWHFLCNAKLVGVADAAKRLIPLDRDDPRAPMTEIFQMFAGRSTPNEVIERAATVSAPNGQSESARFYAHLYVGLYFEAIGETERAKEHIRIAANKHTSPHYMGDVARAHLKLRGWDDADAAPNPKPNDVQDERAKATIQP